MMLHPATVHFAMVLPVVASVFGLLYLINKKEAYSKLSSATMFFAALAMFIVWYTGSQAGPQIYDYLSEAGQHELKEHKELGLYLAIAMGIIFLIKVIGCKMGKFVLEAFAIILLFGATATTMIQGKDGGEIVYNYGMPFKSYMIEDTLKEAVQDSDETEDDAEKVDIFSEAIEDIQLISEDVDAIYGEHEEEEE